MKDTLMLTACVLSFGLLAASTVAVPTLPPSEFADTESVTNLAIDVSHENMGRLDIGLAANATPSNNVQIAFGVDADGDGALEPMETEAVMGWDCGAWFVRDERTEWSRRWTRSAGTNKLCAFALGDSSELLSNIRQPLSRVIENYGTKRLRPLVILNDWEGLNVQTNVDFENLSRIVANRWGEVLSLMPEISTNQAERLVVVAAGVGVGETNFLARIGQMADMALSNRVSAAELRFYKTQCSIADHHAVSSLVRRYQEPPISNLIMKLNAAGAYPQGVSRIFSGEAYEFDLDAVHDGLVEP